MNILLVAATDLEIKPLLSFFNIKRPNEIAIVTKYKCNISILITGPGLISTIFHLTNYLTLNKVDLVINSGIAGAFDPKVELGTVFNVYRDTFADLGAEHADGSFENIFEMGLTDKNEFPFSEGWLYPIDDHKIGGIPSASSVTVNKVTGSYHSINQIQDKYHPDLESMEGAGVFYTCNMLNTPSLQIRSISNYVEPRNKAKWNIPLAIKSLNDYLIEFIQSIRKVDN